MTRMIHTPRTRRLSPAARLRFAATCCALALGLAATTAPAALAGPAKPAPSAPSAQADADRLAALMEELLPFGRVFDMLSAQDPAWPMQDMPKASTPERLRCLRGELSSAGYHRTRMQDARAYVSANPSRVADDIALLEKGAAQVFGRMMMAGVESKAKGGADVDAAAMMRELTPEQMSSFLTFLSDPNYAPLRKQVGLGDVLDNSKSAAENQAAGERLGASLASQLMLKAVGTCNIPMSDLL